MRWETDELKEVVAERVRVSLALDDEERDKNKIWQGLFSDKPYRSRATPEKYIINRTFKRPRDVISFVRFSIETAVQNGHTVV